MDDQIRQTYVNAKKLLAEFGATLDDVVEETLFVLDVPSVFAAGFKVRKEMYDMEMPPVASDLTGQQPCQGPPGATRAPAAISSKWSRRCQDVQKAGRARRRRYS